MLPLNPTMVTVKFGMNTFYQPFRKTFSTLISKPGTDCKGPEEKGASRLPDASAKIEDKRPV